MSDTQLEIAVDEFAAAMKAKLLQKHQDGFRGWDDPALFEDIHSMMVEHAERGPRQAVDVANLAMMLWWQQTKLGVRRCARCERSFVNTHDPNTLAASFCPDDQHMVPHGWDDSVQRTPQEVFAKADTPSWYEHG